MKVNLTVELLHCWTCIGYETPCLFQTIRRNSCSNALTLSERTFVRIYDFDPFSFAKLRKVRKNAKMDTVFILFIEIGVTFSISRYYIVNKKVVNIQLFVRTLDLFSDAGSSSLNLYAVLVFNYKNTVCLEHLTSFDLCLRAQQDFICILPFLQLFSIAWFIPQYLYFYSVNVAINVITIY